MNIIAIFNCLLIFVADNQSNNLLWSPAKTQKVWLGMNDFSINPYSNKFHCPTCNRTYSDKRPLHRHYRFECSRPRFFRCCYCGKLSKRKEHLRDHTKRLHPDLPLRWELIQKVLDE